MTIPAHAELVGGTPNPFSAEIEQLRKTVAEQAAEIERLNTTPPSLREDLRCVISDLCRQVRDEQHNVKVLTDALELMLKDKWHWEQIATKALAAVKGE